MMKIRRLFFGAILISFIPIGGNHQEARIDRVTAEEYAVYSALLNEIKVSPHDGKEVKLFVINDQTEGPDKRCFPEEIARWDDRIKVDELKPPLGKFDREKQSLDISTQEIQCEQKICSFKRAELLLNI